MVLKLKKSKKLKKSGNKLRKSSKNLKRLRRTKFQRIKKKSIWRRHSGGASGALPTENNKKNENNEKA